MSAYFNENDPYAAAWLRNLIAAGHIAPGEVDERSIVDVRPADLRGYQQCHFFAGIGGWSLALRLAGIPDDRPVWTGSCPCQPFSAAGAGKGYADERHLWPHWHRLIRECRPATIFGEQVDAAIRSGWLDDVCLSLEELGYAVGEVDFPACSVGAPHIRQRLYFVAESERRTAERQRFDLGSEARGVQGKAWEQRLRPDAWDGGDADGAGELGQPECAGLQEQRGKRRTLCGQDGADAQQAVIGASAPTNGFWRDAEWLACRDGKTRPTKRGIFPLVAGLPKGVVRGGDSGAPFDADNSAEARVMRLRGYGNSIVPQVAATFIRAALT